PAAPPADEGGDMNRPRETGGDCLTRWFGTTTARRLFIVIATLVVLRLLLLYAGDGALSGDFPVFHTAAQAFADGQTMRLFDDAFLDARPDDAATQRWLYPPHALLLIWPLSLMDMQTAFTVSGVAGWALFAIAGVCTLRVVAPQAPAALYLALVASPACFWPQSMGHPSLFWFAGLLAAMALREGGRRVAAGVLIGVLTYKLTLGVLVAVALLAARDWRGVIAATGTAIALSALATLSVGIDYWPALAGKMLEHLGSPDTALEAFDTFYRQTGPGGLITSLGGAPPLAATAQAIVLLICTIAVAVAWADREAPAALRIGLLAALIPVAMPAVWFYDAVGLSIGAVLLVAAGAVPATGLGIAILVLLYGNVLLPFLLGQPAGLATIPAAVGAIWLAATARMRFATRNASGTVAASRPGALNDPNREE
ncbi:MAG: glycosyltransferase family 87 protein, partial [Pseudomonadota bacterium]